MAALNSAREVGPRCFKCRIIAGNKQGRALCWRHAAVADDALRASAMGSERHRRRSRARAWEPTSGSFRVAHAEGTKSSRTTYLIMRLEGAAQLLVKPLALGPGFLHTHDCLCSNAAHFVQLSSKVRLTDRGGSLTLHCAQV
jgi:hypothetical protein